MKRKNALIIAILIMAIGFAAISTTLIINGSTTVNENADDFSVIFTAASLDGTDIYADVISQDKKTITFETNDLKSLNQTSVLNYEVTNNSANYDAEVQVNCKAKENTIAKYTSIKNELEGNVAKVLAKETINGKLTINLEKIATEEVREEYVCALTFNALERDTLGENYSGPTEWTFNYTGSEQTFAVPISGMYKIEMWGAEGYDNPAYNYSSGKGSYTKGNIELNKNENIYFYIGGVGINGTINRPYGTYAFNGASGGNYTCYSYHNHNSAYNEYGGGATDIRLKNGNWNDFESLKSRIMVAAGGSATSAYYNGTPGGGILGYDGNSTTGATQTSGGGPSQGGFGFGGIPTYNDLCGDSEAQGAGSGYYGGGATTKTGENIPTSSSGASSFISGHNGCDAISEESESNNIIHTGQSVHYSGYKFTDTIMIDGAGCLWTNKKTTQCDGMPSHDGKSIIQGNTGNGYARITLIQ